MSIEQAYSKKDNVVNGLILSVTLFGLSFIVLAINNEFKYFPYYLIVVVTLFNLVFMNGYFNLSAWKARVHSLAVSLVCLIAVALADLFVTYSHGLWLWALSGVLFHTTLNWLLSSKLIDLLYWGDEKSVATRQMQPVTSNNQNQPQNQEVLPEHVYPAKRARFNYEHVHGMAELKQRLDDAERDFRDEGGNGILLYGLPGNGKTFMAEALAGMLKHNFIAVGNIKSKWVGETAERLNKLFLAAKAQAPCVLFMDEIDTYLINRDGNPSEDAQATTNALLTLTADLNRDYANHGVLLVAATNFIEKLDGASVREGRFDKKIEVCPPDKQARIGILTDGIDKKVDSKVVEQVAERWEGFSVSRMRAVAKEVNKKLRQNKQALSVEVLSQALREVQGQIGERLSEGTLSLDDLSLSKNQEEALFHIVEQIKQRHKIEAMGGEIAKGAMFFGPAGTGKTTVAKALAKQCGWAYISTSGPDLLASPDKIDAMIRKASDLRPTILFIDEAEGVLGDRQLNPHTKEITNKLLAVMDGNEPLHDVFFVAATNHFESIDKALLRWGRFSEHIDFTPDNTTLEKVINNYIKQRQETLEFVGCVASLTERMHHLDYSQADVEGLLSKLVNSAVIKAEDKRKKPVINLDDCLPETIA